MSNVFTELKRYCHAGVLNTLVGLMVILLMGFFGANPYVANVAGYGSGLICGFVLSKIYVFKSTQTHPKQMVAFLAAFAVAFSFNLMTLKGLMSFGFVPQVSQISAIIVYSVIMYSLQKFWVFKSK